MNILTVDNLSYSMNNIPDTVVDMHYCVLDHSDSRNVDYIFVPLLFAESFTTPSVDLRIGPYRLQIPIDWHIVIGPNSSGECELINLKQLNDRSFQAFAINPISGYMPNFYDIEIMNICPNRDWYIPKSKHGQLLCVPLTNGKNPECCYIVKETNKIPDVLDITNLV